MVYLTIAQGFSTTGLQTVTSLPEQLPHLTWAVVGSQGAFGSEDRGEGKWGACCRRGRGRHGPPEKRAVRGARSRPGPLRLPRGSATCRPSSPPSSRPSCLPAVRPCSPPSRCPCGLRGGPPPCRFWPARRRTARQPLLGRPCTSAPRPAAPPLAGRR